MVCECEECGAKCNATFDYLTYSHSIQYLVTFHFCSPECRTAWVERKEDA
jgi:hypothetical protein